MSTKKLQILGNLPQTADDVGAISYDLSQTLTDEQKIQARENMGLGTLSSKDLVTKEDLAPAVQESLEKADSALQSETDPTVPAWAKATSKPTYTAEEIGARPDTWMPTVTDVGAAPASHSHDDMYYTEAEMDEKLSGKAASGHTHTASDVGAIANTSGSVGAANIASGAVSASYPATISTSWTGSEAPYTQTITVSGILASDTPFVDMVPDSIYATAQAQEEAWSKIYRIVTTDDTITVYAHEKTSVSVPIKMVVIRK